MGTGGKCDSEHIQAVLTCQGDIDDPDFPTRCQTIFDKLAKVLDNRKLTFIFFCPEMEFKEFESRFKSAKTRFKSSAGLDLETFDTI